MTAPEEQDTLDRLAEELAADPGVLDAHRQHEAVAAYRRGGWPYRVAPGRVTVLDGPSTAATGPLLLDVARRVTRGEPWPGADAPGPGTESVLLADVPDRPDRLDVLRAAGLDVGRVVLPSGVVVLPCGAGWLLDLVRLSTASLVVVADVERLACEHVTDGGAWSALWRDLEVIARVTGSAVVVGRHRPVPAPLPSPSTGWLRMVEDGVNRYRLETLTPAEVPPPRSSVPDAWLRVGVGGRVLWSDAQKR